MGMTLMSNKEAAEVLKKLFPPISRGDGKSTSKLVITMALNKAIEVLENTPEESASNDKKV